MITTKKEKFMSECIKEGIKLIKFKPMMPLKGYDLLYLDITKRRGWKHVYQIPYTNYIDNNWEARAFQTSQKWDTLINNIHIFDEKVIEVSLEEAEELIRLKETP